MSPFFFPSFLKLPLFSFFFFLFILNFLHVKKTREKKRKEIMQDEKQQQRLQYDYKDPIDYYNQQPAPQTTRFMTKYEKARIIGTRALQISMGSKILVPIQNDFDSIKIATRELKDKKIPITLQRKLPDNTIEQWPVKNLVLDDEDIDEDFTVALEN